MVENKEAAKAPWLSSGAVERKSMNGGYSMGKKTKTNKAPSLSESKRPISVEMLGRRQRIQVTVNKTQKQIKKEKLEMKKANVINAFNKAMFYAAQTSLLVGGVSLWSMSQIKFAMTAPVGFTVSIPLYQVTGTVIIGVFVYFEVMSRRSKRVIEQQA